MAPPCWPFQELLDSYRVRILTRTAQGWSFVMSQLQRLCLDLDISGSDPAFRNAPVLVEVVAHGVFWKNRNLLDSGTRDVHLHPPVDQSLTQCYTMLHNVTQCYTYHPAKSFDTNLTFLYEFVCWPSVADHQSNCPTSGA